VSERSLWPLLTLLTVGVFSAGFAAIKALPAEQYMRAFPDMNRTQEWNDAYTMFVAFFSRNQDYARASLGRWRFHEDGAYVGWFCVSLALLGMVSRGQRKLPWMIALLGFLLLALGDYGLVVTPASLLQRLPFFSWQRVASRQFVSAVLCVAVLSGFGVDFLRQQFGRAGLVLGGLLIAAGVFDQWLVGPPNLHYAVEAEEPAIAPSPQFRHFWPGARRCFPLPEANIGTLSCVDFMPALPGAEFGFNESSYRGEQYLDGAGTVQVTEWTPNVLGYDVDLLGSASLIINQRYDPSWQLVQGAGRIFPSNGLIAIALPGGQHHIKLAYRSTSFVLGAIVTALSFLVMLALWGFERKYPQRN